MARIRVTQNNLVVMEMDTATLVTYLLLYGNKAVGLKAPLLPLKVETVDRDGIIIETEMLEEWKDDEQ